VFLHREPAATRSHHPHSQEWLNRKIHRLGSLHANADELMKAATGSPLDPKLFLDHLRTKYSQLYKISL
jgi:carboxypeptidase Taq